MQNWLRILTPTRKCNTQQERNEKRQRNDNTNKIPAHEPTLSNLQLKSPPLIFPPVCSRFGFSHLQSVWILPSHVLHGRTFVPGLRDGAYHPSRWHPPLILRSSYIVMVQRDGADSSSRILRAWRVHLTSISSGCASHSRILQMHVLEVHIALMSSKCASLLRVHISSESTSLLQVHPPPPYSPPCPECCLSPLSVLSASGGGGEKKITFPLPGSLCEAQSAFPSPLAATKPMLCRVDGVQKITAPAYVPVVWWVVGGQCISDGVASRLWLAKIVRNAPSPPPSAVSIFPVIAVVWR